MIQEPTALLKQMKLSTRLIAEEALRRGFSIDYFRGGKTITGLLLVTTPMGTVALKSSVGTLTRGYGVFVANNKLMMAQLFKRFAIPIPDFLFIEDEADAIAFLQKHKRVVVKPIDTDHGVGVTTNITSKDVLLVAIAKAQQASKKGALIQEMCAGIDHRILVVGNRVVAAAYRKSAAIIGDGRQTIGELIAAENKNPLRGQGHTKPLTFLDVEAAAVYLQGQGKSLESVPVAGESIQLASVANLSQGGQAIDVTNTLHPNIAAMAVAAAKIAGLGVAGVDIMCTDITKHPDESKPRIIELNESPGIRMHHFPSKGVPRNVASAILDQALTHGEYVSAWNS